MKVMAIKDYNKIQEAKYKKAVAGWGFEQGGFPCYPMYFFYDEKGEKRTAGFVAISDDKRSEYYGETEIEAINSFKGWK